MNAALGFDTFLVMRHGLPVQPDQVTRVGEGIEVKQLGCYYCSDITAARDVSAYDLVQNQIQFASTVALRSYARSNVHSNTAWSRSYCVGYRS